jgi:hypothetical protein
MNRTTKAIQNLKQLEKEIKGSKIRVSSNGVPHLLFTAKSITYSVAYFGKSDTYRLFYPYPANIQTRLDFRFRTEIVSFFNILNLSN